MFRVTHTRATMTATTGLVHISLFSSRNVPFQALLLRKGFSTHAAALPAKQTVIMSGMQPTGRLHLGNYFGALQNWVYLQDRVHAAALSSGLTASAAEAQAQQQLFFSIVDLHAMTLPQQVSSACNCSSLVEMPFFSSFSFVFHATDIHTPTKLYFCLSSPPLTYAPILSHSVLWREPGGRAA